MQVIEVADPAAAADLAADLIDEYSPRVLGVATGATPSPLYRVLVDRHRLAADTTVCLLDEYIGLPVGHGQRYRQIIARQLATPLGLTVVAPDVDALDLSAACGSYETALADLGGVDLQILGIGRNGHIGFNEPGTSFDSVTHVVELTSTTRADNARFFDGAASVPRHAITQGIATIRRAKRIVLIAVGDAKASAVAAMIEGSISPANPASALRDHADVVLVADREALTQRTTHRHTHSGAA